MTTTTPKTFLQKIAAAQTEMDNPKKRSTNPHFSSKFASLESTFEVITPVLEKYGLSHVCYFDNTAIVYMVFDTESDERLLSRLELKDILDGLSGNVWQQIGQAFTYLRRYLSQAFWGLVPEDTDAQSAPSRPAAQRKPAESATKAQSRVNEAEASINGSGGAL